MNSIINFFKNIFQKKESKPQFFCNCPTGCCCGRCEKCQPKFVEFDPKNLQQADSNLNQFVAKYSDLKSSKINSDEGDIDELVAIKKKKKKPAKKKDSSKSKDSSIKKETPKRGRPKSTKNN